MNTQSELSYLQANLPAEESFTIAVREFATVQPFANWLRSNGYVCYISKSSHEFGSVWDVKANLRKSRKAA